MFRPDKTVTQVDRFFVIPASFKRESKAVDSRQKLSGMTQHKVL